ncbi:MAG: polysaccharide biosynthesis C-terminal domain-containing protein, partial [Candidatus Methanofastidiosa archaeon]|nr:polysaccharide biosynthesis C-terminal domain-containing protein [Candidatus Methanofastidiosa archaeon]
MKEDTKGVKMLRGDPKRAILKLSIPMIVAMSVQTLYNFVDVIWVSGLGPDALSAVGFFLPFFYAMMALSNGIGTGGSSALSRRIGANDPDGADNVANHSIVLCILVAMAFSLPTTLLSEPIFRFLGAGEVTSLAVSYARILFAGSIIVFFTNVANSLLRGEGDTKRAMYAMVLGSLLNIFLDPIFIYTFDMG